jgi:hypothetical protein
MKKLKSPSNILKLQKASVATLSPITGKGPGNGSPTSDNSYCCSVPPVCWQTLTTRPDSLNAAGRNENEPS